MIHSCAPEPDEILEFAERFSAFPQRVPLVVVPSTYNTRPRGRAGGGRRQRRHLRQPAPAQRLPGDAGDGQSILEHGRSLESDDELLPIGEVLRLIPGGA